MNPEDDTFTEDVYAPDEREELLKELRDSFPLTAPYKRDPLEFAKNYIFAIRKWATEKLGVEEFKEE